ncbi:MAG: hypothetical protein ACR2IN_01380 [Thermoleophilaceae bacterium]
MFTDSEKAELHEILTAAVDELSEDERYALMVAFLALLYRESADRRFDGRQSITDYIVRARMETRLSEATILAAECLRPEDWTATQVVEQVNDNPARLHSAAALLARYDPLRLEALLHALARDPRPDLAGLDWMSGPLERWYGVERWIAALRHIGVDEKSGDLGVWAWEQVRPEGPEPYHAMTVRWPDGRERELTSWETDEALARREVEAALRDDDLLRGGRIVRVEYRGAIEP